MGDLTPILAMEVLPGDRIRIGGENIIRLAPMLAPMMHRVDVRIEYFFVPNRLVWPNWETWISNGGDNPLEEPPAALPAHPTFQYQSGAGPIDYQDFPLLDYMGLPDPAQCPAPSQPEKVSAIPFGAYQLIYQDYYRDENLQEKRFLGLDDGDNSTNTEYFIMRKRAWEGDYFTKALPFAQKGAPVSLPIGQLADVEVRRNDNTNTVIDTILGVDPLNIDAQLTDNPDIAANRLFASTSELDIGSTTINDLRLAYRLQEWLEKNARGGTRYSELIRSHFGVKPEDARLQRPEYIVGVKNPIQISEVLNMTGTEDAPQGAMAGHGVSYNSGNFGKYFATEHGYVIGIMSVMPKPAYQQGIPRHFLKFNDPTEVAWPTFAHLGEQEILNKEIMAHRATPEEGNATFGYIPRYQEYKGLSSRVAGEFRTSLDFWHMGRIFDPLTPPALNSDFISADPTKRVFAVIDEEVDELYCQVMNHITVVRALPVYGTPTF